MMGKKKRIHPPADDFTIIVHGSPSDLTHQRKPINADSIKTLPRRPKISFPSSMSLGRKPDVLPRTSAKEESRISHSDNIFEEPGTSSVINRKGSDIEIHIDQSVKKRNRLFEPLAQLRLGGGDTPRLKSCTRHSDSEKGVKPLERAEDNQQKAVPSKAVTPPKQKEAVVVEDKLLARQKRFGAPPTINLPPRKVSEESAAVVVSPDSLKPIVKEDYTPSPSSLSISTPVKLQEQKSSSSPKPGSPPKEEKTATDSFTKANQKDLAKETYVQQQEQDSVLDTFAVVAIDIQIPDTATETNEEMRLGRRVTFPGKRSFDNGGSFVKRRRTSPTEADALPPHLQHRPTLRIIAAANEPTTSGAEFVEIKSDKPERPEEQNGNESNGIHIEKPDKIMPAVKSPPRSIAHRLTIPTQVVKTIDSQEATSKINFINPKVIKSKEGKRPILPFFTNKYVFSNHFPCPGLMVNGKKFYCTEQYYMWRKAKFCRNEAAASAILMSTDPKQMKLIGSSLENVDENGWKMISWKYMAEANYEKYKQFEDLRFQLLRTKGAILMEANPTDDWWGAGIAMDSAEISEPSKWPGENVLGNLLMEIRERIEETEKFSDEVERARQNLIVDML